MKNIIVGTSGHVDHGKTCLIKALTGTDCDRLKEEKKRGITIENGFADMTYGDYNISVIDVPGHEKFVRNMLMGIGGIDLVLLVIGLDEGVMPQTREHFEILSMIGIKRGIIVYTKRDMVEDKDWIELVKEDAHELVAGTFMENCDEIEVSSYDGYNIEELRRLIVRNIDDSLLKNDSDILFRLPVDRVFAIDGFGTVVTGTLMEGTIKTGDEIMIYPGRKLAKIRNVQVHNDKVEAAFAGQRTALNLQGIKKEELERGTVLAKPDSLEPSMMLDVKLEMFRDAAKSVANGSRVHFYCGASEAVAKVVLLESDLLSAGESCFCQLRLEEEIAVRRNDRFIIRFFSPLITVGGGRILEVTPKKHKRSDEKVISELQLKDAGSEKDVLLQVIREKSSELLDMKKLALKQRLSGEETQSLLGELLQEKKIRKLGKGVYIHEDYIEISKKAAEKILSKYHEENKMSEGLSKEEFKSKLSEALHQNDKRAVEDLMGEMINDRFIKDTGNRISLFDFKIRESSQMTGLKERILAQYREKRFEMPTVDEILASEKDRKNTKHIIEALAASGSLVRLNFQYYIDSSAFEWAVENMKAKIAENGGRITLGEFRDILGTSRKYAMAILDYLDESKITKKVEDYRILL
ncbi:MAG: selenocysteine-specific translation elongation factor [Clostridia bacterium]|nr:selenocysteine-specific translation elongation factor [Clostridia bacterium]